MHRSLIARASDAPPYRDAPTVDDSPHGIAAARTSLLWNVAFEATALPSRKAFCTDAQGKHSHQGRERPWRANGIRPAMNRANSGDCCHADREAWAEEQPDKLLCAHGSHLCSPRGRLWSSCSAWREEISGDGAKWRRKTPTTQHAPSPAWTRLRYWRAPSLAYFCVTGLAGLPVSRAARAARMLSCATRSSRRVTYPS